MWKIHSLSSIECSCHNFFNFLNAIEPALQFTHEIESGGVLAFLDVTLTRECTGCLDYILFAENQHAETDTSTFVQTILYNSKKLIIQILLCRAKLFTSNEAKY